MDKQEYDKYREKYPELPTWEEIDHEWEINDIEEKTYQLRRIRRKITDKIERLAQILQSLLQPDPNSFIDLYECRMYDEKDKQEIFEICRRMMYHSRNFMSTALKRDDAEEAKVIAQAYREWMENKENIIKHLEKLKDAWEKDVPTKEILDYMG